MYRFYLLYCLFLCLGNILFAQTTGFEKGVPQSFCTVQSNELSSSEEFYKEGKRSLAWQFSPRSVLTVKLDTPLHLDSISKEKRGITLWIYNEQARKDSLRFEFFSPTGHVSYRFGFRLNAQGWRACWIGFAHMKGDKQENTIAGYLGNAGANLPTAMNIKNTDLYLMLLGLVCSIYGMLLIYSATLNPVTAMEDRKSTRLNSSHPK